MGLVARGPTRAHPPEWVSAKPKRFAWTLGLAMSFSTMVITNSGIRGYLPRTICAICLILMWTESVLGVCLGCEIHSRWCARAGLVRIPPSRSAPTGCASCPHASLPPRPRMPWKHPGDDERGKWQDARRGAGRRIRRAGADDQALRAGRRRDRPRPGDCECHVISPLEAASSARARR